jgi:hypothetical protein
LKREEGEEEEEKRNKAARWRRARVIQLLETRAPFGKLDLSSSWSAQLS